MMANEVKLPELAHQAGASGRHWNDWQVSDEVQSFLDTYEGPRGRLIRECEQAYAKGRQENLRKTWTLCWTTAPSDGWTAISITRIHDSISQHRAIEHEV